MGPSPAGDTLRGDWSSIIGIVTAIAGNVLISFALNTQRYAHIRIEREQQDSQSGEEGHRLSNTSDGSGSKIYGAIQNANTDGNEASVRTKKNSQYGDQDEGNIERRARETDALIPKGADGNDAVNKMRKQSALDRPFSPSSTFGASKTDDSAVDSEKKSYLRSPYWWLGIILMILGESGNFLAYGFAPASIVSPLGVVALISNCLVAPLLFHEPFRYRDLFGVVTAAAGAVVVVLSARGSNPKLGPEQILALASRWEFLTYVTITSILIVILMGLSGTYGDRTIAIDIGLVGLFGAYTALSTKGVASLLSYTLWRALTFPITYALVIILVLTAVMQIRYVNRALQSFDSTQVIPTQFVWFTISVIIGSAVLYRDFEKATLDQLGKFVGGCTLTFAGVWCLTSGRQQLYEDYDNKEEDEDRLEEGARIQVTGEDESNLERAHTGNTAVQRQKKDNDQRGSRALSNARIASDTFHRPLAEAALDLETGPGSIDPAVGQSRPQRALPTYFTHTHSDFAINSQRTTNMASSLSTTVTTVPSTPNLNHRKSTPLIPRQPLPGPSSSSSYLRPGPFTSPLSSSLSVVVADQRERLLMRRNSRGSRPQGRQSSLGHSFNGDISITGPEEESSTSRTMTGNDSSDGAGTVAHDERSTERRDATNRWSSTI